MSGFTSADPDFTITLIVCVSHNQQFQAAVKNGPLNHLARNKCEMEDRKTIKLLHYADKEGYS